MVRILIVVLLALLGGCSHDSAERHAHDVTPSRGEDVRIRFLVMHYTVADDATSLQVLTQGNVSAHYLIPADPPLKEGEAAVYQLVAERDIAWHAGSSSWSGESSLNKSSIGIEIVNPGFSDKPWGRQWYPYSEQQIMLTARLALDIIRRNGIAAENVVGHSDIAPQRKLDPGPLFPWERLSKYGIGAWPDEQRVNVYLAGRAPDSTVSVAVLQSALASYGYQIPQTGKLDDITRQVIGAFQMHFRPRSYSGIPDAETEAIALALVEKYRS